MPRSRCSRIRSISAPSARKPAERSVSSASTRPVLQEMFAAIKCCNERCARRPSRRAGTSPGRRRGQPSSRSYAVRKASGGHSPPTNSPGSWGSAERKRTTATERRNVSTSTAGSPGCQPLQCLADEARELDTRARRARRDPTAGRRSRADHRPIDRILDAPRTTTTPSSDAGPGRFAGRNQISGRSSPIRCSRIAARNAAAGRVTAPFRAHDGEPPGAVPRLRDEVAGGILGGLPALQAVPQRVPAVVGERLHRTSSSATAPCASCPRRSRTARRAPRWHARAVGEDVCRAVPTAPAIAPSTDSARGPEAAGGPSR